MMVARDGAKRIDSWLAEVLVEGLRYAMSVAPELLASLATKQADT